MGHALDQRLVEGDPCTMQAPRVTFTFRVSVLSHAPRVLRRHGPNTHRHIFSCQTTMPHTHYRSQAG